MPILDTNSPALSVADDTVARWRFDMQGIVQGVGFRPFVHALAHRLQLGGWVRNTSCGVEIELQGETAGLTAFQKALVTEAPPLARVIDITLAARPVGSGEAPGVAIRPSRRSDGRTLISPDVATCADCLRELFDPADHRFGYAFINCTHCGPRFTIIRDLPYDRPRTTMASFALCAVCKREYSDAHNRRFHAQPVACAACGPTVWYSEAGETDCSVATAQSEAIKIAVARLDNGAILAIRGLGGFHLCCRADLTAAVARLRDSKFRPSKPLAVMVRRVEDAEAFCHIGPMEAQLLVSPEAPIVLLKKKGREWAPGIAPGNAYVGVMLPYTPLHHLLMAAVRGPLVMTSGNPGGEPLCLNNDEAVARLGPFVDGFVFHNRPIARRCDDSVMMVVNDGVEERLQPVRRSRGLAPLPVLLPSQLALPQGVWATGADLKNVSAVATDRQVFLSAHIGDLRHLSVRDEQRQALSDLGQLFDVAPDGVVCDLHPDYASTHFAQAIAAERQIPLFQVQHHHAHVAGCMAENGVTDPTIGLCFDGTGYGTDGCIWGGEALLCRGSGFERLSHLEYLPLPGGDAAVGKPYRIALAYLHHLMPGADIGAYFPGVSPSERALIVRMVDGRLNTPQTSSMGRLFDAVSALLGLAHAVTHEAQAAMTLEAVALACADCPVGYEVAFEDGVVRIAPMLRGLLADIQAGCERRWMARRFHQTLADLALEMAHRAREDTDVCRVALSGGVWQNRLLLGLMVDALHRCDFEVLLHHAVPANDGGLAYGQVAVVAARLTRMDS